MEDGTLDSWALDKAAIHMVSALCRAPTSSCLPKLFCPRAKGAQKARKRRNFYQTRVSQHPSVDGDHGYKALSPSPYRPHPRRRPDIRRNPIRDLGSPKTRAQYSGDAGTATRRHHHPIPTIGSRKPVTHGVLGSYHYKAIISGRRLRRGSAQPRQRPHSACRNRDIGRAS